MLSQLVAVQVALAIANKSNLYSSMHSVVMSVHFAPVPQPLQDQMIQSFGLDGLIEIVTLCGFYGLIGMVNVCFDVPLPPKQTS